MIGLFVSRVVMLVFGYTYPAYKCFKLVEQNKVDVEELRVWCQYWILLAMLTAFERFADALFIWWLPMYCEMKVAFIVYLWYWKVEGTRYIYYTFFRPYVVKHEKKIDQTLFECKTRAGDLAIRCMCSAWSYGQRGVLDFMQYVASQSPLSRIQPVNQESQQVPAAAASQPPPNSPRSPTEREGSAPNSPDSEKIVPNITRLLPEAQDTAEEEVVHPARRKLRRPRFAPPLASSY